MTYRLLLLTLLLTACGQKGPLYMPAKAPATPAESGPVAADAAVTGSEAASPEVLPEKEKSKAAPAPKSAPAPVTQP